MISSQIEMKRASMSYYDAVDTTTAADACTILLCARLNLRGAKRLLQSGSLTSGISALYDSVLFGMHYYIAEHKDCIYADSGDATALFYTLVCAGVFVDQHAFNRLSLMVERVLWQKTYAFDANATLFKVEEMLTRLGVMPQESRESH